jgi:regulator of sigma E protease
VITLLLLWESMELLTAFLHNALSFIVIISVIVFIHEFGHYAVAKLSGVKIEVFSIGFGKEIIGWNDRSGTRWKVSMLPLGGYVKMYGDLNAMSAPDASKIADLTEDERKKAFHTKPLIIKAAIVAAGPIANFLLAVMILSFFFSYYGKPFATPEAKVIVKGSAADIAGLVPGDEITSIDKTAITSFSDIQRIVSTHPGEPLEFIIKRSGKELTKTITPRLSESKDAFGNPVKIGLLGIASPKMEYKHYSLGRAIILAAQETYSISATTLSALGQMITGKRGTEDLGGAIRIAQYSGQSTTQGMQATLFFIALLSINLGLLNFFPVPLLDGGHLLYYLIEAVTGKPMAERFQQYGFRIGMAMIIALFVLSTYNDISMVLMSFGKKLFN